MLSNELSMVQYNSLQSAILGAQVEEFLRHGGVIEVAPAPVYVPRPPAHYPEPVKKAKRRQKAKASPRVHPQELIDRIAVASATMTCVQAADHFGLTIEQLHSLAYRNGFRFLPGDHGRRAEISTKIIDDAKDLACAERIRAYKDLGVTRNCALRSMNIGHAKFMRLLKKFDIDYPKTHKSAVWVMPA